MWTEEVPAIHDDALLLVRWAASDLELSKTVGECIVSGGTGRGRRMSEKDHVLLQTPSILVVGRRSKEPFCSEFSAAWPSYSCTLVV